MSKRPGQQAPANQSEFNVSVCFVEKSSSTLRPQAARMKFITFF
jgi:hypothetical protein